MKMDLRISSDLPSLSRSALDALLRIGHEAVAQRGRFVLALSGGHTPKDLYSLWARDEKSRVGTPWERVYLFWGDERYVPGNDPLSNYHMVREALISRVPIPSKNVHPMLTNFPNPEMAAEAYESDLKKFFGAEPPAFDLQLLGLGGEGHTASLFPGSPALAEKTRWVAAVEVPANPHQRITLTLPVLNEARNTFFLVAGAEKREIVAALRQEPETGVSGFPAARVRPKGSVAWFVDQAAVS